MKRHIKDKPILFLTIMIMIIGFSSASAGTAERNPQVTIPEPDEPDYHPDMTLRELSIEVSIPVSKLREHLSIPEEIDEDTTIKELGIADEDIQTAQEGFAREKWSYSWNIVLVGMLVIFSSLALTGLLVNQLQRFVTKKKSKSGSQSAASQSKQQTQQGETDENNIIAAIAALQVHLQEAEESNKLIIAWSREPASAWKTSGRLQIMKKI